MKIGVSSYSFYKLTKQGRMSLLDEISKAKEMGFDFIEFAPIELPEGMGTEEYARMIKEETDKIDIEIGNYAISADFLGREADDWKLEAERLKAEVDAARILGVAIMRHDASRGFPQDYEGSRSFDNALPNLIAGCRAVTEYAAKFGIRTMVENHGYFCQDSERLEKLVCGVNHPNFGLLLDMGNFLFADEEPAKAFGRLMPYAFHVHAKDFHIKSGMLPDPGFGWVRSRAGNYLRGTIIGHGEVPVVQCLQIMKQAGYTGSLSMEYEGMEDVLEGIELGFDYLRKHCN